MLQRLVKPWFLYRPTQLIRRAIAGLSNPSPGYASLRTSWGVDVLADPSRTIGRSIVTTGLYDLALSETLVRLISPGDTVVDAGANVGYVSLLAGVAANPNGRILSFEPHPELFDVLQRNVNNVKKKLPSVTFDTYQVALGDRSGTAELQLPSDFETNDGVARINLEAKAGDRSVTVRLETLDEVLENASVAVLKLDVEGFEPQVLRGASRAIADQRIKHVVFEEHSIHESETVKFLRKAGYQVFSLGWSLFGPRVQPVEAGNLATHYEAPSFLGTLAPDEVLSGCRKNGWLVLSRLVS